MAEVNLADIQGFILRGYTMPAVRHFLLRVGDAAAARRFLGGLVSGDEAASPQLTTAQVWTVKPDYCLNVALTFDGLKALGLPAATLSSFPAEFQAGSVSRAESVGDTGPSAPALWDPPFNSTHVHVILSLYAAGREVLEARTAVLKALFECNGGMAEAGRRDGYELPDGKVHFGYQDGISQPNIDGAPGRKVTDMQPVSPSGAFLLGYPSQFVDFTYPVPAPDEFGKNGSFVAFRVLQQDCAGFERFLSENAPKVGMGPEKLAAKLCGRWRNGVPIELSPDTDSPQPPIPREEYNDFDYVVSPVNPNGFDDRKGYRCPIGSHLRRNNPRGERVAGGDDGRKHRIIRRGIAYGPPFDPDHPDDSVERGLLGLFIGVSLLDQFEFLMSQWVNEGIFTPGIGGTKDPILGANDPASSKFTIPDPAGAKTITGFSRFVITRGSAYGFLPSATALRFLASAPPTP
ncbi:MAG TPA: peroxidase [Thermoanaerobaculia bacterium]|nr:peroxidase [Thermoanaerobaculia bacterium]